MKSRLGAGELGNSERKINMEIVKREKIRDLNQRREEIGFPGLHSAEGLKMKG